MHKEDVISVLQDRHRLTVINKQQSKVFSCQCVDVILLKLLCSFLCLYYVGFWVGADNCYRG